MKLQWTIKFYHTGGMKKPHRVKIEGPGQDANMVWAFGEGKGESPSEAYNDAIADMQRKPALAVV